MAHSRICRLSLLAVEDLNWKGGPLRSSSRVWREQIPMRCGKRHSTEFGQVPPYRPGAAVGFRKAMPEEQKKGVSDASHRGQECPSVGAASAALDAPGGRCGKVISSSRLGGVLEAMQLRNYSSYFQPEEFDALTAAYDAAWQELWAKRLTLTSDQIPVLQKNLSQIILASACNGKRDVEQLKEIALRGVAGGPPST